MNLKYQEAFEEVVTDLLNQALTQLKAKGTIHQSEADDLEAKVRRMVWNTLEVGDPLDPNWMSEVIITAKILTATINYVDCCGKDSY